MAFSINQAKEQAVAPRPVLLAEFRFADGTYYRCATIPLTFGGNAYAATIEEQEIERLASLSEQGVDRVPSASIRLADPGGNIWQTYERAAGKGFRGATLKLTYAAYDVVAQEFSTDSFVPFLGVCGLPEVTENGLTISAVSRLNLTRYQLPTVPIQPRCPWINPVTTAQRAEANDKNSRFYRCGETRDLGTAPPCSYTKATCTQPLKFGGSTWEPERTGSGREYISGNKVAWRNADTSGKFRSYVPLWLGGVAWLDAVVLNQVGDGNYTRGEAVVGVDAIDIELVTVNGLELSFSTSGDFRWHYVNNGSRDGTPNGDRPYNGQGDPYGNLTVIQYLAPRQHIDPSSTAGVRVRGRRKNLTLFDGSGNTYEASGIVAGSNGGASTPWVLMEALRWGRFNLDDIDAASWLSVAGKCDTLITYTDQNGATSSQPRFSSAIAIRERRTLSDVVRGLRQSIGALLVPGADGKLHLRIEGTLAEQQPSAVDGSNYNTPVASTLRDGTAANGYVAYRFDESNFWNVKRLPMSLDSAPNRVSYAFSDPAVGHAVSSFALVDSDDVARTGQEMPGGLQVEPEGIASHNHALRAGKLGLAKIHRGNPEADTRGTDWIQGETTFRGCRLQIGQIIMLDNDRLQYDAQLFRITELKPTRNFERITVTGHWHDDSWYLDSAANAADPGYSARRPTSVLPLPWRPFAEAPVPTGNATYDKPGSLFDATDYSYRVTQDYELLADGTQSAVLEFSGRIPVSELAGISVPQVARQGTTANTGGSIPGAAGITGGVRRLYVCVSARNSGGILTPRSELCIVDITDTGNNNTATVPVISWDPAATGYALFAGWSPQELCWQKDDPSTPSTITITSLKTATWPPPDPAAIKLRAQAKRGVHTGTVGALVTAVGANTITCQDLIDGTDNWNGRDVSVVADSSDGSAAMWNFHVTAYNNATGAFTVIPAPTDVQVGDVLVVRMQPSAQTATTITDSGLVNKFAGSGLDANAEVGNLVRIITGKGRGQVRRITANTGTQLTVDPAWDVVPDSTSRFIVEAPDWEFTADTDLPANSDPAAEMKFRLPIANALERVLITRVLTVAADGRTCSEALAPVREIYVFGRTPGLRTITADYTVQRTDKTILVDTAAGPVNVTLLPGAEMAGLGLVIKLITNGSADTPAGNDCTIVPAVGEDIDGAASVVLDNRGDSL